MDDNVFISGGWDDNVKVWDLRSPQFVGLFYGPHICGDAIDINPNGEILTGSYSKNNQVQLWDMKTLKVKDTVPNVSSMLYAAQFSKVGAPKIGYGGVISNGFSVVEKSKDFPSIHTESTAGVYTMDFSPASHHVATAGFGDRVGVLDLKRDEYKEFIAVGYRDISIS
jgi:COMPASS component SWD3